VVLDGRNDGDRSVKAFIIRRPVFDPLPWSESFAVGDEELDAEHHCVLALIDQICLTCEAKPEASVLTLLREPQLITKKHLEREEALLQEIASGMVKIAKGCGKSWRPRSSSTAPEHRQRLSKAAHPHAKNASHRRSRARIDALR
jgi:hypothetical protein